MLGADRRRGGRLRLAATALVAVWMMPIAAPQARADSFATADPAQPSILAVSPASLYPVDGPAMNTAQVLAERYWGERPCRGRVAITWASMGSSVNAIATWSNRAGAYADPARNERCAVQLNSDQPFDWPSLCTVLAHEFGHLTGHQHAATAGDVMNPVYSVALPDCANTAPPTGPGALSGALPSATDSAARAPRRHRHRHRRHRLRAHPQPRSQARGA